MYAIEFRTKIRNGVIEIPLEYRKKINDNVKVIVLAEKKTINDSDIIEELLDSPLKINGFTPLKREEIYDR